MVREQRDQTLDTETPEGLLVGSADRDVLQCVCGFRDPFDVTLLKVDLICWQYLFVCV